MIKVRKLYFVFIVLVLLLVECFGDVCYKYSYYYYNIYFEYCSGYCYGYYGYEYCSRKSSYMSGGSIAGMVIGILFFAAIIVAIVFVCKRSQARRRQGTVLARGQGTILTRGPHANVAVTHTTTTGFAQHPAPSGYPPPPAYGNVNQYPNMAAYPSPPTYSHLGNQGIGPSAPAFGYGNPAQPQYASSFNSMPPPHMSGGSIAGMVIGILFFAAIIVAIVFVCKRNQARRRRGTVLARGQGTILTRGPHANVAVTHTTTTGFVQHPAPSGYPPPPAYGNVNQYPNMAAYPPPPTYSHLGNQGIGPSAPAFGYGNPAQPQYASSFNSMPPPHM